MPDLRCHERAPRSCLEAFSHITEQLGRMSATLDAIHQQSVAADGRVTRLSEVTGRHDTEIQLLEAELAETRRGRTTWGRRLWQAAIGLALLIAGYLLNS
ncbi:MAG TPA: hypothetical protein VM695_06205 [Phycisphaerae bacterium]|nr:hypothetical protein [Phycisphaerae bacterium]